VSRVACACALCVRVGVSACRVSRYCVRGRRVPVVPVGVRALLSCNPLILKGCSRCSCCSRYKIGHMEVIQGVSLDNAVFKYCKNVTLASRLYLRREQREQLHND
jgi:hypothetical protein